MPQQKNILAVVLWMMGALLSFSGMAVALREVARVLPVFDILAIRYAVVAAILLAAALVAPSLRPSLRPRKFGLHLVRNVAHFGGTYAWAVGVTLLPLATVFALEFTTPVWVALLAVPFLGERLTAPRVTSLILGLAGVLVVLKPGAEGLQPAALLVLLAALAFGATNIATKLLTRGQGTFTIILWMNLLQLPLALAGSDPASWGVLGWQHALPLAGVCLGGLASHWCLTNAYRNGDAMAVVPLDFLRIPLIATVGWLMYGEPLDPYVFAGAGLIILGIVWNLRAESRAARL